MLHTMISPPRPFGVLVCLLGLAAAGCSSIATTPPPAPAAPKPDPAALAWTNPLVPQRADPHVFLHTDGYYYLTATVPAYDRIESRRARTLAGLATAEPRTLWNKHVDGPMSAHIWAPELHQIDGKWYVYFAAGRSESIWHIRMYVLENTSADPFAGEWIERGQIQTQRDAFALDATTFVHRGQRYLVWTESAPPARGTNIYIAAMDTPWSVTGPEVVLTRPDLPWERRGHNVNEGPAMLVKNGRVFLAYSASATDANYCLGLLTASADANLLDPASWSKAPEPVFKSEPAASQFGPGHNSFTTTPDGLADVLVYHSRNYEKIAGEPLHNPDRATRAQALRWRADGTPFFEPPVADGPYVIPADIALPRP
jgi:GH43 family beta-xylosidase